MGDVARTRVFISFRRAVDVGDDLLALANRPRGDGFDAWIDGAAVRQAGQWTECLVKGRASP